MGVRDTIRRFASTSTRKPLREAESTNDSSSPNKEAKGEEEGDEAEEAPQHDSLAPQKITGKRKVSYDAASRSRRHTIESRSKPDEPTDYLYFGDQSSAPRPSAFLTTTTTYTAKPSPSPSKGSSTPNAAMPARDDSGYLNTGMRVQQMGYQNLTYGGSLQFNYSDTQPPF
ncbi:hypothetical protein BX600DRAFT_195256 [Xylariales sp. PMI_506]|nr:hypothetical protein BX600DRAFT_195256 [Xylariales sp. PMI_506]